MEEEYLLAVRDHRRSQKGRHYSLDLMDSYAPRFAAT